MKRNLFIVAMIALSCGMYSCKNANFAQSTAVATDATVTDSGLTGKHWKLVELMGGEVTYPEGMNEAYISFQEDGKVYGNSSCNSFSGTYTLQDGKIRFSQMISTRKMCLDNMEIETKMLQILNTADNYILEGDNLILNRARMAPLARFIVVVK
jgi:heat shock protein HslJ